MKIAIVGSEGKFWTPVGRTKAVLKIKEILIHDDYLDVSPFDPGDVTYPTLVSGGCGATGEDDKQKFDGGIDVWAEIVADFIGLEKDIKYAEIFEWNSRDGKKGFKARNMLIAYDCDVLYCIEPKVHITSFGHAMSRKVMKTEDNIWFRRSGGMWTLEYAEKLGREVHLVVIE